MSIPRFIDIDGRRYLWRDLLQRRRDQLAALAKTQQPTLFALHDDCRPAAQRTASSRYQEPSLFSDA
jgi:hypothetical protein